MRREKIEIFALIPARSGSKRVPQKNIRELGGVPLVEHTIKEAIKSKYIADILLSSDDDRVIQIGRKYPEVITLMRPADLAGDAIRNIDVMRHAVEYSEATYKKKYDVLLLLQPTSPFRKLKHIDAALQMITENDCDAVVSVRGPYKKRDPIIKSIKKESLLDYCEQIEPFYIQNAAIYAIKRDEFISKNSFVRSKTCPLVMDEMSSIDIDTELDFRIANLLIDQY